MRVGHAFPATLDIVDGYVIGAREALNDGFIDDQGCLRRAKQRDHVRLVLGLDKQLHGLLYNHFRLFLILPNCRRGLLVQVRREESDVVLQTRVDRLAVVRGGLLLLFRRCTLRFLGLLQAICDRFELLGNAYRKKKGKNLNDET